MRAVVCYAVRREKLQGRHGTCIKMACGRAIRDCSTRWTTAVRHVSCGRCKVTRAFAARTSAGGFDVTGEAPIPPVTHSQYVGTDLRSKMRFLTGRRDYIEYLGDDSWANKELDKARRYANP